MKPLGSGPILHEMGTGHSLIKWRTVRKCILYAVCGGGHKAKSGPEPAHPFLWAI